MTTTLITLSVLVVSLILAGIFSEPLHQPLPSNLNVQNVDTVIQNLHPDSNILEARETFTSFGRWFRGIQGPESIHVVDNGGGIVKGFVLDRYGYLYSGNFSSGEVHLEAYVGPGRPLGFHVLHDGKTVIICNALIGLMSLDLDTKHLSVLSNGYTTRGKHVPLSYANDLDIDEERSALYFTDSTNIPPALNRLGFYDTMKSYMLSALSGRATGALLRYDMNQGTTRLLMEGLHFANGVAVSDSGDYVLVAETSAMRLMKYHVGNGSSEVLIDSLPGYPDGLCRSHDGTFWVAIVIPCVRPTLTFQLLKSPAPIRWILSWLFSSVGDLVKLPKMGMVLKINGETGEILRVLLDETGEHVAGVSGVYEYNDTLYFGHLQYDYITSVKL